MYTFFNSLLIFGCFADAILVGFVMRTPVRKWRLRRYNRKFVRSMQHYATPLASSLSYSQPSPGARTE